MNWKVKTANVLRRMNLRKTDETTCSGSEDSASNSNTESVPHTVVFKCIGAVRDTDSQTTLRTARDRLASGWTVPVRMRPEPTNIRDSRAVVFECKLDGKWIKVGYVVSNILDEVNAAINSNEILDVQFKWVKFITMWTRSGPGYYAGISVTKNGQWEPNVLRFRSTR